MYGIGVIGLGVMGQRMIEALRADRRFRVVAGFDPAPPPLSGLELRDTAKRLINDPAVDCVYIAAPPAAHAALVAMAATAGKAIFCEKPLAATRAEANACVDAVRAAAVPAGVNFPFATAAAALRLCDLVAEGELGEIRSARLTLRFATWPRGWQATAGGWLAGPSQGGFMREVGSHFLFLARRLWGDGTLVQVSGTRGPAGTETAVRAAIRYAAVTLDIDAAVAGDTEDYNRLDLTGSRASAAITDWYRLDYAGQLSDRLPSLPSQVDGLARLLAGDSAQPLASIEDAADVVRLVEQILAGVPART